MLKVSANFYSKILLKLLHQISKKDRINRTQIGSRLLMMNVLPKLENFFRTMSKIWALELRWVFIRTL